MPPQVAQRWVFTLERHGFELVGRLAEEAEPLQQLAVPSYLQEPVQEVGRVASFVLAVQLKELLQPEHAL